MLQNKSQKAQESIKNARASKARLRPWKSLDPGREFAIPKLFSTLFFWGDLGREQYQSLYGVNSDGINRSVYYVHYILEQKKSHENTRSRFTHDTWAWRRAWVWCLTHRANSSDANGRCIFLFIPTHLPRLPTSFRFRPFFFLYRPP